MATTMQNTRLLIEKIQSLPTERIAEVEDFVDFLSARTRRRKANLTDKKSLDFPIISVGKWPEELNLHREDLYGNDGR